MTQKERLLNWFLDGNTLTRLVSFRKLGIVELSSRIIELQHDGWVIKSETVTVKNRWGEKCRVAQYWMEVSQ